ncbi:MAG: hypothetical protein ACFCVB_04850 [Nodosilinea sp.]
MLSSLLTQFRHRYPQGNLTSDLLTIHDGLYLVRVCAGADGVTLACGLSAHATLEQAEDLATTRALERLGLTPSELPRVTAPTALVQAQSPAAATPPTLALVPLQQAPDQRQPVTDAPPILNGPSKATPPGLEYEPSLPAPEPPPIALTPPPPSAPPAPPDHLPEVPDLPEVPNDFDNDLMNLGAGPVASVDLSDIIAQTDVELQRLGWDVNQGREFLEKTYGKRSRHDLTDDELLEFLLFLETQSPPSAP